MNHSEIVITLAMFAGLLIPAALFLIRVAPARRTRPGPWQNGLWFVFGFLVSLLLAPFVSFVLVPFMLVAALITAFIPGAAAKHILFLALGEVAGEAWSFFWIALLNYHS